MTKEKEDEELVTVDGLKFRKYQMDYFEAVAKMNGYDNLTKWFEDTIMNGLIMALEVFGENYADPMLIRLKRDGYGLGR